MNLRAHLCSSFLLFSLITKFPGAVTFIPKSQAGPLKQEAVPTSAKSQAGPLVGSGWNLSYWGGRIVPNLQTVVVLWGSGTYVPELTSNSSNGNVVTYIDALMNSTWSATLDQYSTATQTFVGGQESEKHPSLASILPIYNHMFHTALGPYTVQANPGNVNFSSVQDQLFGFILAGDLPAPTLDSSSNPETMYAIFFPAGVNITGSSGSGPYGNDPVSCESPDHHP